MGLCSSRECCDGEPANDCCASGGDSGDGHTLGSGTECVAHCEDGASGADGASSAPQTHHRGVTPSSRVEMNSLDGERADVPISAEPRLDHGRLRCSGGTRGLPGAFDWRFPGPVTLRLP